MIIKSFRCLGISLPIDGSCDSELLIKGLRTSVLSEGIKREVQLPAPATGSTDGGLDFPDSDSDSDSDSGSDAEILSGSDLIAAATGNRHGDRKSVV